MHKFFTWLICFLGLLLAGGSLPQLAYAQLSLPAQLQASHPIPEAQLVTDNLDLRPFSQIWNDTESKATYITIDQLAKLSPFLAGSLKSKGVYSTFWLRFQIQNSHPTDTLRRLFFGGYHLSWALGHFKQQVPSPAIQVNGWLLSSPAQLHVDPFTLPLAVPPGQTHTYWFQTTGYGLFSPVTPRLFTSVGYEHFRQARLTDQRNHFGYCCSLIGICLFLSVFAGVQSVYAQDITYFHWSLYLAVTGLLFVLTADLGFNLQLVGPMAAAFIVPVQYLIGAVYLLFLRSFLKLSQYIPRLNRLVLVLACCLFLLVGISYWSILTLNIPVIKFIAQLFLITQTLVLLIFVAVSRAKVPNRGLFIIGSVGLNLMASVAALINKFGLTDFDYFWTDPAVWFSVGVIFELICFNLALSQRSRLAERDKQRLEHEKELENQRLTLITEHFQQRIAETEMAGLRAQMNPHFIFNCLNSIQFFTAQNDAEKASDYLAKFSRLIRLVLENSKSEKVTLNNELETLRLYIDMEAMRFNQKVHYRIDVGTDIDTDDIQIPPLLLQPFVENAIWHGLMHKEEGGLVVVSVQQPQENLLHIEITDDGVGRQKAAEYKSKSATKHKSFGMKMTADRIELINQLYNIQTQVQVEDIVDELGKANGTKVRINIPI